MEKKKKYIGVVVLISILLLVGILAGADLSDKIKIYEKDLNKITIFDSSLKQEGYYILEDNSQFCTRDCYAEGYVNLEKDAKLYDSITFLNKDGKNQPINYKFFIIENSTKNNYEEEQKIGLFKWRLEGKKEPRSSIDWILNALGVELSEWSWWNSWQDWNDDLDDNKVNSTLFINMSCIQWNAGSGTFSSKSVEENNDNYIGYVTANVGAGENAQGVALLQLKQDFKDGRNYNITINTTLDTGTADSGKVSFAFTNISSYGDCGSYANIDYFIYNNQTDVYKWEDVGEIGNQTYVISIDGTNNNATLYSQTALINTTYLKTTENWYLRFIMTASSSGTTFTQQNLIYNITISSSGADMNVVLIHPANSTSDGNYTRFYQGNLSMTDATHRVLNGTLWIWNVSDGTNVYNNTETYTGTNWSEIANNSVNLPYGNYTWTYSSCGNDSSNIDCSSTGNYSIELRDFYNPNATIIAPVGAITSKTFVVKINTSDYGGVDYCYFNISRGASTEVADTRITNCSDISSVVSADGDYMLWLTINDTANNLNITNASFSVSTSGGGLTGGGGGTPPTASIVEGEQESICVQYREKFFDLWNRSNKDSLMERIKFIWTAFWDYAICGSAASIVPI